MSRLSIEIDPEQHRQIKTLATFAGMTIKDYILSKTIPQRAKPDATAELLASRKNAKRLRKALATPPQQHVVFENVEELARALGI
jgi:Antitoxin ParD